TIWKSQTGDVACDHYNRYAQDVELMSGLGLQAYRLSINWARVMPDGVGRVNEEGLAFYDRLIDELLARKITPWVTLFHWDYPQALALKGGWQHAESSHWFAEYAASVVDRLSDRVRHWITINEPQIFIGHGHKIGDHAPGLKLPAKDWLLAGHNALLAHGRAVQTIRARAKTTPTVGWAPCARVDYPATDSPADVAAARRQFFSVHTRDAWNNAWWGDAAILGRYPEDGLALFGADAPKPASGDMATIAQPLDFFGVNIYSGEAYRAGPDGQPVHVPHAPGCPASAFRWPIVPQSVYWAPRFLHERYRLPIYITENGMANTDFVSEDGQVHDPQRIEYTRTHLREIARAIKDTVDIRGYFHWSILDNFEWAEGYSQRFGLIHVDFATQKRTLKDSAHWYRKTITERGASL
ncbi:MAG: family 1 glycosylhydrolase, partial [Planctomycetota bacterium]